MKPSDSAWLGARLLCGLSSTAISLFLIFVVGQHTPLRIALGLVAIAFLLAYFATFPLARRRP